MMLGIIAAGGGGLEPIEIVAAYPSGTGFGGYEEGVSGSITPFAANCIPGAKPVFEADGMITGILYERYEGVTHTMLVTVVGEFLSVPFTQMIVDGGTPIGGWVVYGSGPLQTQFRVSPLSGNPIPAGPHLIEFQ